MVLTIIKYNAGNIQSVLYALERIGVEALVTDDHAQIKSADKVIFPGVGEASSAMRYLKERGLDEVLKNLSQPVLGICLGMQLMCKYSEENNTECLGIFDEKVRLFKPVEHEKQKKLLQQLDDILTVQEATEEADETGDIQTLATLKVPQIGWNTLRLRRPHPLFDGIDTGPEGLHAYFVHSYMLDPEIENDVLAVTDYGGPVTAAVCNDNMAGTQFHPEKSQALGLALIANFLRWTP